MPKEDLIEMTGVVIEAHPKAMFKVKAEDYNLEILCTISGKIRKNHITIAVGDRVKLETTPIDLSRGRITFRMR